MSSFESMSATLSESNWGLHSPPMYERNYACDRWVFEYFRLIDLNVTGPASFQRQLYFCLFGQALYMKAQIEGWRADNIFGLLLWQYNEVWPTGGKLITAPRQTRTCVPPSSADRLFPNFLQDGARWSMAHLLQDRSREADGNHCNTFWLHRLSPT